MERLRSIGVEIEVDTNKATSSEGMYLHESESVAAFATRVRERILAMANADSAHYEVCWSCPTCAFTFAAYHTNADGSLTCVLCESMQAAKERDTYRAMLCDVIASAHPNERDHPAMSKQWKRATDLLRDGVPIGPVSQPGEEAPMEAP